MKSTSFRVSSRFIDFAVSNFFFCIFYLTLTTPSYSQNLHWESRLLSKARHFGTEFRYVGLQELAEELGAQTYYSNKVRKAILYLTEDKITVTAYNPYVLLGQDVLQMPIACQYRNGDIYLPVKFFFPIIRNILGNTDYFANGSVDLATANVTGVEIDEKANGILIRVQTLKTFDQANIRTRYSRKWLYIDILDGRIREGSFSSNFKRGLVRKVVPVQLEQMVQLSLQLSKDISSRDLDVKQHGNEIWISIPNEDRLSRAVIEQLKTDQEKWRIDKIVIDPGHGGRDPGAIGPRGAREKDVVLAIAKRLRTLLEKELKIQVFMTREKDNYLSLPERTQFANSVGGKLFVSIHANSNRNRRVKGSTTYFLGPAKSEEALEIAQRENAVIRYDDDARDYSRYADENLILAAMAQNGYNIESEDFADMIQKSIGKERDIIDRGVKQANFYVLVGASMPNVLVETAFISSRAEERLLQSSRFQQSVARAVFRSVKQFKEKYEGF